MKPSTKTILIPVGSIVAALILNAAIIALTGRDPVAVFRKMLGTTLASPYGQGQVLFRMTTLVCTGLAVALPFRLRLFNIGAQGQLILGAFAAALTGAMLPEGLWPALTITLPILAAMTAGALWGALAGVLKTAFGVSEVISTIMLNFIAEGIAGYLLTRHFALASTVHTAPIRAAAEIPTFWNLAGWFRSSPANLSLLLALLAALLFYLLIFKSRFGFEMRSAGLRPEAAARAGINPAMHALTAMALGGAAAGLAAANLVLGYKHFYEAGMVGQAGFTGIAAALLAGAHPLWVTVSAGFLALLEYGGLAVNAYVPKDIFMVMEAVTILLVVSFSALGAGKR
ncbi:ABC transporter permease [Chlorobium sp. N1]|uniref:ABC transporter permease n=1 Tax=Chlorobium sp. N1 TaxID=2491138 RepID=UPI001040CB19|nr:ABC transporter permease [Chlorobium sp. N1]TCD48413.1 ABC transporter permease [Chlorobium sp. N1]